MQQESVLTECEIGFLSEVFDEPSPVLSSAEGFNHMISVTTEVPQLVASLLGQAKFTLLAEVGHYKLWFPLDMSLGEFGQPSPVLGIPEVLEYSGNERSWRLDASEDIRVHDEAFADKVQVLSLSSTGVSLELACDDIAQQILQRKELLLTLPDGQALKLAIEPVRQHNKVLAARITACKQQRELLRRFLFQRHRQHYPALYKDLS